FLAEVMVDAVDLALVEHLRDVAVEGPRAGQIMAEGLFDHHTAPGRFLVRRIDEAGRAELRDDCREEFGGDGQVIESVAVSPGGAVELVEPLFEARVARGIVERPGDEYDVAGEMGPERGEVGAKAL